MSLTSSTLTAFKPLKAVFLSGGFIASLALAAPASADFQVNLSLDYGNSDDSLVINGASTSFGFGALIPELVWSGGRWGAIGVGYGYGYGPDQEATLGPVSGRGDLESDVIQISYNNQFSITDQLSVLVMYENRKYEVSGTLDGSFGSRTAPISVVSDIEFEEMGEASLTFAVGMLGFVERSLERFGANDVEVNLLSCRALGDAHTLIDLSWFA